MKLKLFLNRKNILDPGLDKFFFIVSSILYSAPRLLTSDSENAILCFENLFRVICLCLLIIVLISVCLFV